ncbi:MAG: TetR/AcrR family transcriptional regulator, partial [Phycisphaerae bacterium]
GTIYLFFKGKDELYGCVIHRIAQDFIEQFEKKVLTLERAEDALAALIELRLTHFDQHQGFFRLIFGSSPGGGVDPVRYLPSQCLDLHTRYMEAVTKLFRQGIAQGTFDDADPLYLALCLEGIINAFVAYWTRHPPTESLPERIAKLKREFLGRAKVRLGDGTQ